MSKKYMVAVDGSENSDKAVDIAGELAQATGAQLTIIHVVPQTDMPNGLEHFAETERVAGREEWARHLTEVGEKTVGLAKMRLANAGVETVETALEHGNAAEQIAAAATAAGTDMLFVGSRGLSNLSGLIMGSVSHKVLHLAPCTCVAVK